MSVRRADLSGDFPPGAARFVLLNGTISDDDRALDLLLIDSLTIQNSEEDFRRVHECPRSRFAGFSELAHCYTSVLLRA